MQQLTVHCIPQTVSYLAIIIVNTISLYSYEMQFEQLIQMHCPIFFIPVVVQGEDINGYIYASIFHLSSVARLH